MWEWSAAVKAIANDAARKELIGAELRLLTDAGKPLAVIPLSGNTETVTGEAAHRGKASRAVIEKSGRVLASAPADAVCDTVYVERAAKVTVTVKI